MPANRLAAETSPYLLQHRDNPVHWQPWDSEAFDLARRTDRPILLSIGYSACHWCHVMAHESFADPATAALMNTHFVSIKVDREERPDLDAIYQTALALLGESGGWPATLFLTPDAHPFWGGTYFPPQARFGRPAFPAVLSAIAHAYRTQGSRIQATVLALRQNLSAAPHPPTAPLLPPDVLEATARLVVRHIDHTHGGLAGQPKFPQVPLFRMLWRAYRRTRTPAYGEAVILTLDALCHGGIYDHLGGGFARYSTDAEWLAPHFEKMLYDNALLIDLLTEVWRETRSPLYAARIAETIAWLLADLVVPDPADPSLFGLATALDADSEGQEGRYYLWSADEIDSLLGSDSPLFKTVYDVKPGGNWEGSTILRRSRTAPSLPPDQEQLLAGCRAVLLAARRRRIPPQRDHKVLADTTGLAITALARAGATFAQPDWISAARTLFAFATTRLAAPDGHLYHTWCHGLARHRGILDDYAHLARAALALFDATGERSLIDQASLWADTVYRYYRDPKAGGYFLSAADADDVPFRTKTITDGALPSANAIMLGVFARLFHLTGLDSHRARAEDLVRALSPADPDLLIAMPAFLFGRQLLEDPVRITLAGDPSHSVSTLLERVVAETAPFSAIIVRDPNATPAVHLCRGTVCEIPFTDPLLLRSRLAAL